MPLYAGDYTQDLWGVWSTSVERERVGPSDCLSYVYDSRALTNVKIVNQAGVYAISGTVRTVSEACKGGTSVSIQGFLGPVARKSGAITWRDVASTISNPDVTFALGFSDPDAVAVADGWRLSAESISAPVFGCSAATKGVKLPDPEPTPPPPPTRSRIAASRRRR